MLDAKNCTKEAYNYAMNKINEDINRIPTNSLYILYTKFKTDAVMLRNADNEAANEARRKKALYWNELVRRKTTIC